ncbi:hypothetical protein LZ554_009309 [Drepanopeziza brunnea f. sp. 'monogermtubi']|nr:hypothetical protein LZ554_009309 [Drepanopeziza brunnea f. sp. 'monogermtubi']
MDNANFIPLGEGRTAEHSGPRNEWPKKKETEWGPEIIGKTPEERKAIARDIRVKLRKEKKQEKSAAKAARKANEILHRELSKNTEKYNKNKERNKQRAIDVERLKIRNAAVRQAERLAAIHDPSGKTFNVGEIITLPGGIIKTKEAIRKAAEAAEQKEKEEAERKAADLRYKNAELAAKLEAEEARKAAEEGRPVPTRFPAKEALKGMKRPKRISKKKLQRQEMLKRLQETPPKPIIPAGISLPEGEENMLALWDISDTDIMKRLHEQKKQKTLARKDLKKIQKEAKKLKKELKIRKRQAEKEGIVFDKAKARKEILAEQAALQAQMAAARASGTRTKSESESGSDSDSDSESDSESESDNEARIEQGEEDKVVTPEKSPANVRKLDLNLIEKAAEIKRAHEAKKLAAREKRRQERREKQTEVEGKAEADAMNAKQRRKAARKAARLGTAASSEGDSSSKKRKRNEAGDDGGVEAVQEGKGDKSHKKKKSKSESAVQEPEVEKAEIETEADSKKREKKAKREAKALKAAEEEASREMTEADPPKKDKKSKKGSGDGNKPSHGAEQWHPEALSGDAARKDKFLRLLGAGKEASKETEKDGKKSTKRPEVDIDKIAADLERQFEAGTKMKHDGGGKRRGLGS